MMVLQDLSATLKMRRYRAYSLNPRVNWAETAVQQTWGQYGNLVGKFLSLESPLTLDELLVLCRAYAAQHGGFGDRSVEFYTLDYALQELCERGIVLVDEWRPFAVN